MASAGYISYPTTTIAGVGALSNLPCVIDLADAFGAAGFDWADVRSDGGNVYVTDDADVRMPAYIEEIDTTAETGLLWIRKPSYNGGTSSTVRIYIDDLAVTAPAVSAAYGRNEVFQDSFHALLFQNGDLVDATGNYPDMTDSTSVSGTDGKVGDGFEFAANERIYNPSVGDYKNSTTLSTRSWVKLQAVGAGSLRAVLSSHWDVLNSGNRIYSLLVSNTGIAVNLSINGNATTNSQEFATPIGLNTWMRVTLVKDGASYKVYKNGQLIATTATTAITLPGGGVGYLSLGRQYNAHGSLDGFMDNHIMSLDVWSDDYIKATYENENDPAAFWGAPTWVPATAPSPIFIPQIINLV